MGGVSIGGGGRREECVRTFQSTLVDGPCGWETIVLRRFRNVDCEHLKLILIRHHLRPAVQNRHRALRQAVLLLELRVHQEQRLAELGRTLLERLLEEVARALELGAAVALDELGEVDVPELEGDGEGEELDAAFVDLRARKHRVDRK